MKDNEMSQPLPKATPDLAKAVWGRQQSPSARSVARALTQAGRPVHFTTVNRWRGEEWRDAKGRHPLDQARAALESALPLMTRDPTSTIDDLVRGSPERQQLEELSDGQLLRKAARELASNENDHPLPIATPEPATAVITRQQSPTARSVALALTQ